MLSKSGGFKRKPMGMASFLDVIFLLLFYVIMTTTFSRFGEVTLTAGGSGAVAPPAIDAAPPVFLQLGPDSLRVNGADTTESGLSERMTALAPKDGTTGQVLIALADAVTAQRLTDILVLLRASPEFAATVLE